MNTSVCDSIIDYYEVDSRLNTIEEKVDAVLDKQKREVSFLGFLFLIVMTLVTNLWAQHVYNSYITNYGRGTHGNSDSLILLLVFSIIAIGVIIFFVMDLDHIISF